MGKPPIDLGFAVVAGVTAALTQSVEAAELARLRGLASFVAAYGWALLEHPGPLTPAERAEAAELLGELLIATGAPANHPRLKASLWAAMRRPSPELAAAIERVGSLARAEWAQRLAPDHQDVDGGGE